jgi:AraC-like DNA-binding protein
MPGSIRSASLTNYAEVARKAGLDPARMLSEFGLPIRCLRNPDLMVPIENVRRLLETSAQRSGVESLGLLMAEHRKLSNLGPVGLLIREQPTLRHAIQALSRHSQQLNETLFLTLEEVGDVIVLREVLIVGHGGAVRQSTELAIAVVFKVLRAYLGPAWQPQRVCFAHAAPRDRAVHERVFGRRLQFDQDFNGIVFTRKDLDSPNPQADPAMARYAQQMVDSARPARRPTMPARVRELIVTLLTGGGCSVDLVAQHLGVTRRTVHRQLAAEGESYEKILDSVRRELAARYLRDRGRSLAEVSSMLGFAAPSGFSRWYKRQFGASASTRRKGAAKRK